MTRDELPIHATWTTAPSGTSAARRSRRADLPRLAGAVCGLLLVAIALTGCSPWYGVARVARYPGADVAAVRRALQGDSALTVTERPPSDALGSTDVGDFRCERGGRSASVAVKHDPDRIRVSLTLLGSQRGDDDEIRAATALVQSICDRLDAQVPGVGPWEASDTFLSLFDGVPWTVAAAFVGVLALLFGVQYAEVRRRRRARAAAEAAAHAA